MKEKKERKFEEMITELEEILKELQNGNEALDVEIDKYKEAMK